MGCPDGSLDGPAVLVLALITLSNCHGSAGACSVFGVQLAARLVNAAARCIMFVGIACLLV